MQMMSVVIITASMHEKEREGKMIFIFDGWLTMDTDTHCCLAQCHLMRLLLGTINNSWPATTMCQSVWWQGSNVWPMLSVPASLFYARLVLLSCTHTLEGYQIDFEMTMLWPGRAPKTPKTTKCHSWRKYPYFARLLNKMTRPTLTCLTSYVNYWARYTSLPILAISRQWLWPIASNARQVSLPIHESFNKGSSWLVAASLNAATSSP